MRGAFFVSLALASAPAYAQAPPDEDAVPPDVAADAHTTPPEGADEPPAVLEVNGRVHVRWTRDLAPTPDHPAGELSMPHARLQLTWHPNDRVEGQLGADFAPVLSGSATTSRLLPQLLDAFVAIDTAEWLTLRAGHRKVPFSGARLISLGDLVTVRRGEYVGLLSADDAANLTSESLGYAGRKLGADALLEWRALWRLHLDLGISQGDRGSADPAARVTVRPVRGLHVAAAVAVLSSPGAIAGQHYFAPAYELDALWERWRWRVEIEGATGMNWLDEDHGRFTGGYALAAYEIRLGEADQPSVEPHVKGEFVDRTADGACDEVYGATFGGTLRALDVVRLQLDLEHLDRADSGACRPTAEDRDETRVFLQLAFDV